MDFKRPTWAEVDTGALAWNVRALASLVPRGTDLMAIVKANGYGHGAIPVARTMLAHGAQSLGVATLDEAIELREAGFVAPILVLGWTPPEEAAAVVQYGVAQTVTSLDAAETLAREARRRDRRARIHVKIDTGMGRLGFPAGGEKTREAVARMLKEPSLEVKGIYTHFAVADEDPEYTNLQLSRFRAVLADLARRGLPLPTRHAANSAALLGFPESHLDLVRPGISLYGYDPAPGVIRPITLKPALTWKTRVAHVKTLPAGSSVSYGRTYVTSGPERVATLPVGYADGYSRALSNKGEVLIHGRRARILGRVCMDQIIVSVEHIPDVAVGDEVVLLGAQGEEAITADEMAAWLGTISYEVLTTIGSRVPRVYV